MLIVPVGYVWTNVNSRCADVRSATVLSFLLCLKKKPQDPRRITRTTKPTRVSKFSKAPALPPSMAGKYHIFSPTSSKIFSKSRSPSLVSRSISSKSRRVSTKTPKVGNIGVASQFFHILRLTLYLIQLIATVYIFCTLAHGKFSCE